MANSDLTSIKNEIGWNNTKTDFEIFEFIGGQSDIASKKL